MTSPQNPPDKAGQPAGEIIAVDPKATAEKEAREQFANPDEARAQGARSHELSVLRVKMGPVGRLIGSADVSLTISFVVLLLCFVSLGVAGIASMWHSNALASISSDIFKIVLTVVGYVVGKSAGGTLTRN